MGASSMLVTETLGSEKEEHISFCSHTQQAEDVFIAVQKQLSRQEFLFYFHACTMNCLVEYDS